MANLLSEKKSIKNERYINKISTRKCTNCREKIKIGMPYYILSGSSIICSDCYKKKDILKSKITIDLDWLDESELSYSLKILEKRGFTELLEVKVSPGGNGFHIKAFSKKYWTDQQIMCIRRQCYDDWRRVRFDSIAGRQKNILFDFKETEVIKK